MMSVGPGCRYLSVFALVASLGIGSVGYAGPAAAKYKPPYTSSNDFAGARDLDVDKRRTFRTVQATTVKTRVVFQDRTSCLVTTTKKSSGQPTFSIAFLEPDGDVKGGGKVPATPVFRRMQQNPLRVPSADAVRLGAQYTTATGPGYALYREGRSDYIHMTVGPQVFQLDLTRLRFLAENPRSRRTVLREYARILGRITAFQDAVRRMGARENHYRQAQVVGVGVVGAAPLNAQRHEFLNRLIRSKGALSIGTACLSWGVGGLGAYLNYMNQEADNRLARSILAELQGLRFDDDAPTRAGALIARQVNVIRDTPRAGDV